MLPVRSFSGNSALRFTLVIALLASACGDENGPSGAVTEVAFCPGDAPDWFAVQDGDGPWIRREPVSEGVYQLMLKTGRGGIAWAGRSSDENGVMVNYGVSAEFASIQCRVGDRQVRGSIEGATSAVVWLGFAEGHLDQGLHLTIHNVEDGPQDLLAQRYALTPAGYVGDRYIIRRSVDVPPSGELALLDFDSGEEFAPAVVNLSVTATGVGELSLSTTYRGNQGSMDARLSTTGGTLTGPFSMNMVPVNQLRPGELNSIDLRLSQGVNTLEVITFVTNPTDMALAPGPVLPTPQITSQTVAGVLYPAALLPSQPEYGRMATASFGQDLGFRVTVTASYLEGTPPTWELRVPDLTHVDGWNESWNLDPARAVDWAVSAAGGVNLALGDEVHAGDHSLRAELFGHNAAPALHTSLRSGLPSSRPWGFH